MNVRYPNLTQKKFRDEVADALSLKNNDKIKKPQKRTPPDIKLLLSPEYRPKAPVLQVMKWRFLFMINFLIVGLVALVVIAAVLHRYFPSALENLTMQRETDARRFVSLDSVPPGALLTIDGRKMNFKTPARLSFSGDKSHEVIFELAGYQPCTVSTNKVSSSYVCKFKK